MSCLADCYLESCIDGVRLLNLLVLAFNHTGDECVQDARMLLMWVKLSLASSAQH